MRNHKTPTSAPPSASAPPTAATQRSAPSRGVTPGGPALLRGALVIGAAAVAAWLVWFVTVPLAGVSLHAAERTIGPAAVVVSALAAGCIAGVGWILLRNLRSGVTIWTVLGWVVLALSLTAPALSGATGASLLALELMHIVVGATVIIGFRFVSAADSSKLLRRVTAE